MLVPTTASATALKVGACTTMLRTTPLIVERLLLDVRRIVRAQHHADVLQLQVLFQR
jgi:hypothetical protein